MQIIVHPDPQLAAADVAARIARRLRSAIKVRGAAHLALSGGSTPAAMIEHLLRHRLDWPQVTLYQVDERVVADGDPARNVALLVGLEAAGVRLRPMGVTRADLVASAADYASQLPSRLDVVHLGVGVDGHTASWPAGDAVVDAPATVGLTSNLFNGYRRMTLTPATVNVARARIVHAVGVDKAEVIAELVGGRPTTLPIGLVRSVGTTLVVDRAAAQAIPSRLLPTARPKERL